MRQPPMIGTINGRVVSYARFATSSPPPADWYYFKFDGTTKELTLAALREGLRGGDEFEADFGAGYHTYVLEAAPHDTRACGFWARRLSGPQG